MYNLATTFMRNNEARRPRGGKWGIKKYLLPNGPRLLLTLCSYGRTVKVISRDAEENNKKESGKMGDEGDGEKDEEKEKRVRARDRERKREREEGGREKKNKKNF